MYDYEDGFFLDIDLTEDERQLTALWLLAGSVWMLAIGSSVLGATWIIRHALRLG